MATRGAIGRPIPGGFEAVMHHWDAYPTELGQTLWSLYHGHFTGDTEAMTRVLIDEHPAGWSSINDTDFSQAAGYGSATGPECYCHGTRAEEANPIKIIGGDAGDWTDLEWAYVLRPDGMVVMERRGASFELRAFVPWDGVEPDWQAIEDGATEGGEA